MVYEIFHILNCGCEIKQAMILAVMTAIHAIAYGSLKNSLVIKLLIYDCTPYNIEASTRQKMKFHSNYSFKYFVLNHENEKTIS